MKKQIAAQGVTEGVTAEKSVHPLQKSYMIVSTGHVDYNNPSAFEAASMTVALVLAVLVGVLQTTTLV